MRFRNKQSKPLVWEKVLSMMLSGDPIAKEDFDAELGDIAYKLSTFIWRIKIEGGTVKVVKDGRKVSAYQLMNVAVMQKYMDNRNKVFAAAESAKVAKVKAKPVKAAKVAKPAKKTSIKKLADLNAVPTVEKTEVMEITEVTENPVTQ